MFSACCSVFHHQHVSETFTGNSGEVSFLADGIYAYSHCRYGTTRLESPKFKATAMLPEASQANMNM